MRKIFILILFLTPYFVSGQTRWSLQQDGSIQWNIKQDIPHYDHIEMSGEQVSTVMRYGVNIDSSFSLERSIVWPMLRTIPNNTHASLMQRYAIDFPFLLTVNNGTLKNEKVKSVSLNGILTIISEYSAPVEIGLTRLIFPSTSRPMICERYILKNNSARPVNIIVPEQKTIYQTDAKKGVEGSCAIEAWPEGSQRHLSAESGLFCRIVTEGIFGIRPTGLRTFTTTPRLPQSWQTMRLKKIHAFGSDFDINVNRENGKIRITVYSSVKKLLLDKLIKEGEYLELKL